MLGWNVLNLKRIVSREVYSSLSITKISFLSGRLSSVTLTGLQQVMPIPHPFRCGIGMEARSNVSGNQCTDEDIERWADEAAEQRHTTPSQPVGDLIDVL